MPHPSPAFCSASLHDFVVLLLSGTLAFSFCGNLAFVAAREAGHCHIRASDSLIPGEQQRCERNDRTSNLSLYSPFFPSNSSGGAGRPLHHEESDGGLNLDNITLDRDGRRTEVAHASRQWNR